MIIPGVRFTRENKCLTQGVATIYDWSDMTSIKEEFTPIGWCPEDRIDPLLQKGGGYHPMLVFCEGLGEIWCHVTWHTIVKYFPNASSVARSLEVAKAGISIASANQGGRDGSSG